MEPEFWRERWATGAISFHLGAVNPALVAHWAGVAPEASGEVFVPLCGKSVDLRWLAARGHAVLGVELADAAVRAFFEEAGLVAAVTARPPFEVWSAGGVEIWCGDYFELPHARLANVSAAYDRASLIALPAPLRARYAAAFAAAMPPGSATLLVTLTHDLGAPGGPEVGPPFSVEHAEVEALYRDAFTITRLAVEDATETTPNLRARGANRVENTIWRLDRKAARP
jgi:thiopurine S-methyltransferase